VTTPKSSYNTLAQHPSLAVLFNQYPLLRAQLKAIYTNTFEPSSSTFPPHNRGNSRNPRGRGRGRGRGGYHDHVDKGPWTPERGVKDALKEIKKLKEADGDMGMGMKEFLELLNKIIGEETTF
jgi:hypothetical protein